MHAGQLGAPQMNGAAGSNGQMLQVLDACLINGFNPQTVTTATKTATSATLTFGVSHGYEVGQLILVSGATDAALNGNHRIISKATNTVTIDAVGVAVTTGTITTKVAPLGWQSIFGTTDPLKRAYRSNSMQSSKTVLYLDMSLPTSHGYNTTNPAKRAMVDMCENMTTLGTQINSYTSAFNNRPTIRNGKMFWYQCRGTTKTEAVSVAQNRSWIVVGNDKFFFLLNEWQFVNPYGQHLRDLFAFGDMLSMKGEVSASNCGWLGATSVNDADTIYFAHNGAQIGGAFITASDIRGYMIKSYNGTGTLKPFLLTTSGREEIVISGREGAASNYPNPATQSMLGLPIYTLVADEHLRARIPSILFVLQNLNDNYAALDMLASSDTLVASMAGQYASGNNGFFAFDLKE